jgi:4-amino-4-deoxy-L-arabinose transferase-like glycosyltransferase
MVRYLLRFPLWPDEGFLATNFLDRDYLGLLAGLDNHQVAPLLFLWTQLTVVKLLGFSEYTLRLFPLACGVGGLLLFADLARRLLKGLPLVLAVGCFAGTYALIRYSCDAKPYSSDVLVAVVLLWMTV